MIARLRADPVAVLGSVLGLISCTLGWLTLKPNRLVAGSSFTLPDSFGWPAAAVVVTLWVACLLLGFINRRYVKFVLGTVSTIIIVLATFFVGMGSRDILREQPDIARVSLGIGYWLGLAGAYMLISAARQAMPREKSFWRAGLLLAGPAAVAVMLVAGRLNYLSVLVEFAGHRDRFWQEVWQHLRLVAVSVGLAAVMGVAMGIWATRSRAVAKPVFFLSNIVQTVPSLALFGLLIAPMSALSFAYPALRDLGIRGVGVAPAVIALTVYSLLPIVHNTYAGLRSVDRSVVDAATGLGMTRSQVFRRIEAPLGAPLVLEGIRTAAVQGVGLAVIASLIGAGGLGWFVFTGIGQAAPDLIILGTIPIIVLALIVDTVGRGIVTLGTPPGRTGTILTTGGKA